MKTVCCFICIALVSLSCSKQTEQTTRDASSDQRPPVPMPRPAGDQLISVGKCRIVATVVAIDSSREAGDPSSPCAQYPCKATARVDSILGYGSSFGPPLTVGQNLSLRFMFTIGPTKNLFKNMPDSYPGLSLGSSFRADISGSGETAGSEKGSSTYTVSGYDLRK